MNMGSSNYFGNSQCDGPSADAAVCVTISSGQTNIGEDDDDDDDEGDEVEENLIFPSSPSDSPRITSLTAISLLHKYVQLSIVCTTLHTTL